MNHHRIHTKHTRRSSKKKNSDKHKTLRKRETESYKYNEKHRIIHDSVYKKYLKNNDELLDYYKGIIHHYKKSQKAYNDKDIQLFILNIMMAGIYAGTLNSKSSVGIMSTYEFPLSNPNYMLEYKSLHKKPKLNYTRREKRYIQKKL